MAPLERFVIEQQCKALSSAFAYHLDRREYSELTQLFAPDGVWIRHYQRLEGRQAILNALSERPAEQFTRHVTTGFHFIEVTQTHARSVATNMSYFSFDAATLPTRYKPEKAMLLDFVDNYIKTAEGWRFLERDTQMVMVPEEIEITDKK